jgi:hypothetical protein
VPASDKVELLRVQYEGAEIRLRELDAEYEAAKAALEDEYGPRLRTLGDNAHRLQKELCDAEAVGALLDRPDGRAVARELGLKFPE